MVGVRLFYDLPDGWQELSCHSFKVYECVDPSEDGTLRGTYKIRAGVDYIDVQAEDQYSWFKLEIVDEAGNVIAPASEPILAELAVGKMASLRLAIKDTAASPAFSNGDLMSKMRLAALRLNNTRNLSTVPDRLWGVIELLVRIDVCYVLAFDFAKYQKLEIPGGATLSRDELYIHYLNVAKQLEEYYSKVKQDLTDASDDTGDMGSIVSVSSMTRDSYQTGREENEIGVQISHHDIL